MKDNNIYFWKIIFCLLIIAHHYLGDNNWYIGMEFFYRFWVLNCQKGYK